MRNQGNAYEVLPLLLSVIRGSVEMGEEHKEEGEGGRDQSGAVTVKVIFSGFKAALSLLQNLIFLFFHSFFSWLEKEKSQCKLSLEHCLSGVLPSSLSLLYPEKQLAWDL